MFPHMCITFQPFSPFTVTSTRKRSFSISLLDLTGLPYRTGTAYRIRCPFVWTPLGFTQVHPAVRAELRDIFGKLLEQRLFALLRIRHILLDAPSPSAVGTPDAVEKETEKAQETAKEEKSDAKTPETSDSKKSDSGSSSKKDDTPAHQHNWVAQTKTVHHDAQYKTVHHDAVTHQVWHDAVTEEHYICNQCGADITSDPWGHINNSLMNGGNCGSYHSTYVTVKQGYYETVTDQAAYDEQVQVRDAWDETVTTGYKCSSCGATE